MKMIKAKMELDKREGMRDLENYVYIVYFTSNPLRIQVGEILDQARIRALSKRGYKIHLHPPDCAPIDHKTA